MLLLLLLLQGLLARRRRRSRRPWAKRDDEAAKKKGLILCSSWSSCFVPLLGTVMVLALPSQATPCQQPHYIRMYGLGCLASTYWMRSHARAWSNALSKLSLLFPAGALVTEVWESLFTATRPASLTTAAAAAACWPTRQRRRGWRGLESCCCCCSCWIPFQLLLSGNSYWL